MKKNANILTCLFIVLLTCFFFATISFAAVDTPILQLTDETVKEELYDSFLILSDRTKSITIDDIASGDYDDQFIAPDQLNKQRGFFGVAKWIRLDIHNQSSENEWLLEFAFPLIYQIHIYEKIDKEFYKTVTSGAEYPFREREINHRHFVFNLDIDPYGTKSYYILVHGGGDLHPPINLWQKDAFIEKMQTEFVLLGLFYGMIFIMILYNAFLYISLRTKAYLYYIFAITSTLLGYMSLNGDAYKLLWPNNPSWNIIAVPFLVSIASIFIILFTRSFLDTKRNFPEFTYLAWFLSLLNILTILLLSFSYFSALNMMLLSTFSTFVSVLAVGFICLFRGVREARFFVLGWVVFLTGTFITILERASVVPYNTITEYAGQAALSIEVVLLSLALADKINIMRHDKAIAEKSASRSQALLIENLKKTDELKDEFLAVTSHELRTPLYGMIGIAESLRDGVAGKVPEEMINQLEMIIMSGQRLSTLVNDILDFSKLKHNTITIDMKQVNLADLVNIIISICQPLLKGKEVKLINKVSKDLPPVLADPDRLQQILYNLIGNAIKYTEVGTVTIKAALTRDGDVNVAIIDTGKGIAREHQEEIFELFQQGNASTFNEHRIGTGIGLSITKRLLELHDSHMKLISAPNRGSTFSFVLRAVELVERESTNIADYVVDLKKYDLIQPRLTKPKISISSQQKAVKVLVVDDEIVNLQVLMNQLMLEGMEVVKATNGQDALMLIAEEEFDLVILDIMMPVMSGYEVCEQIRQQYTLLELPILMLTAKSQVDDKVIAFEMGANDYVTTPCDREELLLRVRTLAQLKAFNDDLTLLNIELETKVRERTIELENVNEDLSKKNKSLIEMTDSRSHLLANISHELGTPVTVIHGYIQAVREGLITADEQKYLSLMDDKVTLLTRLIDDLADLSKLEAGQLKFDKKEVELERYLQEFAQNYELIITKEQRKFSIDRIDKAAISGYVMYIDQSRIEQVFNNIIWNAIKHTEKTNGEIKIDVTLANSEVIFIVSDNGVGISQEDLQHIFERFYQGEQRKQTRATTNRGLGLTIVKEIVEAHDGTIWVESELGTGSKFYISLPIYPK